VSTWREVTLGEVCELKRGYDLPRGDREAGAVPIISSSGPTGFHREPKVRAPGVVTGRYGTLGRVFYVTEDFWPLNTALYVRDFRGNDPRYVAALLESMNLAQHDAAAAVPGLNRNQLHGLPVRVLELIDQRVIAGILGALDDLIENNRRRVKTLEEMARAIYREWFVHFRYPGHEGTPLVDSALGPIPDDWEVNELSEVAELTGGSARTKASYVESGYVAFSAAGPDGYLPDFEIGGRGVVLSAVGARCGRTFRATGKWSSIANTIKIVPRTGVCGPSWLYWATEDPSIWPKRGSAQPFISINDARAVRVLTPDTATGARFESACGSLDGPAERLRSEMTVLAKIRDLILPKLVTGQIDVSSLDIDVLAEDSVA